MLKEIAGKGFIDIMNPMANLVQEYYDSQEWKYDFDDEKNIFSMRMGLKDVDFCRVITHCKERGELITLSFWPLTIPESKRQTVAEYLTRANYGLNIGNFELDMDDGEVRYKVSSVWGEILPSLKVVERLVDTGFVMLDRYGSGLLSVVYGNATPQEAIKAAEIE